jgi:histidinol-phosphate aminotransferase
MPLRVPDHIRSIPPYVPGKPIEELERELGISGSIKLASNENPLGPCPAAMQAIEAAAAGLHRYPDGAGHMLIGQLARHLSVEAEQIIIGNGSDEIIAMLCQTLLGPGDEVLIPQPSFLMYEIATRSMGATPVFIPLRNLAIDLDDVLASIGPRTRMVFLCNPNNPTGSIISKSDFKRYLANLPNHVLTVIDEAYVEFVRDPDCLRGSDYYASGANLVSLRTFSKLYGLAGLRVGYAMMPGWLAELVNRVRLPFNVNTLAQVAAVAALADTDFVRQTLKVVHEGLDYLQSELSAMGITCFPTQTNFFLIDVRVDADRVFAHLLREGLIVRSMRAYGYPHYIRINVGRREENARFLEALKKVLRDGDIKGSNVR